MRENKKSLGERAVEWSLAEMGRFGGKRPPDARIREYFSAGIRDDPEDLDNDGELVENIGKGIPASANYCAAAFCFATEAVVGLSDSIPHDYHVSGLELEEDAKAQDAWIPIADVRAGVRVPKIGDALIKSRGGPNAKAWWRHVGRVIACDERTVETVDANGLNRAWSRVKRSLDNPELLGFISYEQLAPLPPRQQTKVYDTGVKTHSLGLGQKLQDAGVGCLIRYYTSNPKSWKLFSRREADYLASFGIQTIVVYQDGATTPGAFGWDIGSGHAEQAISLAHEVEQPEQSAIYFAVDYNASEQDIRVAILPYFEAVCLTVRAAGYRVGVYGEAEVCDAVLDAGHADLAWLSQSKAFRGTKPEHDWNRFDRWTLRQHYPPVHVGNYPFDENDIRGTFEEAGAFVAGQAPTRAEPAPHPEPVEIDPPIVVVVEEDEPGVAIESDSVGEAPKGFWAYLLWLIFGWR